MNQRTPDNFRRPDASDNRRETGGRGQESREVSDVRRQLQALKSSVDQGMDERAEKIANDAVEAIVRLRERGVSDAELQQLTRIISQTDAEDIAARINGASRVFDELADLRGEVGGGNGD